MYPYAPHLQESALLPSVGCFLVAPPSDPLYCRATLKAALQVQLTVMVRCLTSINQGPFNTQHEHHFAAYFQRFLQAIMLQAPGNVLLCQQFSEELRLVGEQSDPSVMYRLLRYGLLDSVNYIMHCQRVLLEQFLCSHGLCANSPNVQTAWHVALASTAVANDDISAFAEYVRNFSAASNKNPSPRIPQPPPGPQRGTDEVSPTPDEVTSSSAHGSDVAMELHIDLDEPQG